MNVRNGNELPMNTLFFNNTVDTVSDDERRRVLKRGTYTDSGLNGEQQVTIGPSCVELYPLLAADDYPYNTESPLATLELREMMASTTLAVLNDAEKYTTIVGEDTSGRIPALVIGKAVNIVRQRSGLPKARRLFISGAIDNDQVRDQAFKNLDKKFPLLNSLKNEKAQQAYIYSLPIVDESGDTHFSTYIQLIGINTSNPSYTLICGVGEA